MGNEARKFERPDFNDEQLEAVAKKRLDSGALEDIQDIRKNMAEEMAKAKMDGILNEKDVRDLQREIDSNTADEKGIQQVANKVRSVIDENKNLIDSFVKGLTSERSIDDKLIVKDHIDRFKALSTDEKRTYVKNLRSNLDWVETLYKEVLKHSPDKIDAFRRMTGKEKKSFIEELKTRAKNIDSYGKLIEANKEHFSTASKEEYMAQFKELKTLEEQKRWISEFSKEVQRKAEVTKKFKTFPPELQAKFPEFFEARKNQRLVILQKMERALEEEHLNILNSDPNARHFSEKDRAEAIKWWKQSSVDMKIVMLKALPGHLKKTAELSKKYEAMPDGIKLDVQQKLGFTSFYELNFDEKNKAIEESKKLGESTDKMITDYEGRLKEAVAKKYLSKKTADAFMKEFKDLTVEEKTDWMNKFEAKELTKRKEITEKFQNEIPEETQQKNGAFYEMGYHDRVKLLAKLLGVDENEIAGDAAESNDAGEKTQNIENLSNDANRLEREGNNAPSAGLKKEKWTEAMKIYRQLLKLDAGDEIARSNYQRLTAKFAKAFPDETLPETDADEAGLDGFQIDAALENAKQGAVMHDKMKNQTIAHELTDLAGKSELYNANTTDSQRKDKHLGSQFERELNDQLLEHTGGETVLNKEGQGQDIRKVDVKNMDKLNAQQIHELKKEVTSHRGNKAQNVHHLQLSSRESGQNLNAQTGRDQVEKNKAQLQGELAERAAQALKARGKKLTAKDIAALHEAAAKDDLYVKLQEVA